ncbi:hypothetical protein LLEC1_01424 [Akanthomyces lecanii]|uniref:AB hydrolase-1 domain-containing protein n=1 Tax=Cordyceps confragosa TaxID=2714763 RepID=A0A179I4T1_CORDF|nr:hypothetical protein LLEC1_01424 [Akanthomyces lecanii]
MAPSDEYSKQKGDAQHLLQLSNNRQIAYACNGPEAAGTVVLFFSGIMSIGMAHSVPQPCQRIKARWIAPTPAGMGLSSTRDLTVPYHVSLARDVTALLDHLYPAGGFDTLYVAGGSYGTVMAQMLYGAAYDIFPGGRKIVAGMVLAGFSPYKYDKNYGEALNWNTWLSVGPPSQLPFRPLQRAFRAAIGSKMNTVDGAKKFLRFTVFDVMDAEEKEKFATHVAGLGETTDEFITRLARSTVACCKNWDGFMEVSDVIHSDWGFEPSRLDAEHCKPLLVVQSADDIIGSMNSEWIAKNYSNAARKTVPGGHVSSMYYMDDMWEEMITCNLHLEAHLACSVSILHPKGPSPAPIACPRLGNWDEFSHCIQSFNDGLCGEAATCLATA